MVNGTDMSSETLKVTFTDNTKRTFERTLIFLTLLVLTNVEWL
jgi:hypothetical protein